MFLNAQEMHEVLELFFEGMMPCHSRRSAEKEAAPHMSQGVCFELAIEKIREFGILPERLFQV